VRPTGHVSTMTAVHEWTSDLVFVAGVTAVATAVVLRDPAPSPVRILFVLPLLLFLPGYALVSVLFPERRTSAPSMRRSDDRRSIGRVARAVLSIGLSLGIVPAVAFVANFSSYGIRPTPVILGISAVTFGCVGLALIARLRLPADERFRLDAPAFVAAVPRRSFGTRRTLRRQGLFDAETPRQRLLNGFFVFAVLVLVVSAGIAVTVPRSPADDAEFTEFYLLTQNESGDFAAEGLPREFDSGQSRPVYVGIENHERAATEYTTVVRLQDVGEDGQVREEQELDRFQTSVAAGETARVERELAPTMTGDRLRVVFLLYRGDPPPTPTVDNAYRDARLWITVGGG